MASFFVVSNYGCLFAYFLDLYMSFILFMGLFVPQPHDQYFYLYNAPLRSLFGIDPKSNEKTLARCDSSELSFHNDLITISPPTHFGSSIVLLRIRGAPPCGIICLACIWRCVYVVLVIYYF